jgi:hypothetical protein
MSKPKSSHRVFSRAFKLGIVNRMLAGEKVRALARELQFSSKDLYIWRDRFLSGGPEALRGPGRPRNSERSASRGGGGVSLCVDGRATHVGRSPARPIGPWKAQGPSKNIRSFSVSAGARRRSLPSNARKSWNPSG